ncbi:hypothetical protein AB0K48_30325 [Nonomuraea sp. NPDC055795]
MATGRLELSADSEAGYLTRSHHALPRNRVVDQGFRTVTPGNPGQEDERRPCQAGQGRTAVERAGEFAAQPADIEEIAAVHELLVYRFFKKDRPALFELAGKLRLKATSSGRRTHLYMPRDLLRAGRPARAEITALLKIGDEMPALLIDYARTLTHHLPQLQQARS